MQELAYVTMLLNHFLGWEFLGLAFPIFCYSAARGLMYSKNVDKYIMRVLIAGLISQLFWPFREGGYLINEVFSIGVSMLAMGNSKKADVLKVVIVLGWLNGVIAAEALFIIATGIYTKKYMYIFMFVYPLAVYFTSGINLFFWWSAIVIIEMHERKYLTGIEFLTKRWKYIIYPLHLGVIRCLKFL